MTNLCHSKRSRYDSVCVCVSKWSKNVNSFSMAEHCNVKDKTKIDTNVHFDRRYKTLKSIRTRNKKSMTKKPFHQPYVCIRFQSKSLHRSQKMFFFLSHLLYRIRFRLSFIEVTADEKGKSVSESRWICMFHRMCSDSEKKCTKILCAKRKIPQQQ